MDELRALFTERANALERAKEFRDARIRYVLDGHGQRPLASNGRLFVHIVPLSAVGAFPSEIDLQLALRESRRFRPIGALGMTSRFNFDGFVNERGGAQNLGYTQVFRVGILEATKANLIVTHEGQRLIAGVDFERNFFDCFGTYIEGMQLLGISPPFVVMVTLEGVLGLQYMVRRDAFEDADAPLDRDVMKLPECVISDYGDALSYQRAVRPAFDALWNAIGRVSARFFNHDGLWTAPQ